MDSSSGSDRERLAGLAPAVAETAARLERDRVVERIWNRDHTVWSKGPREVVDRLGWLEAPAVMRDRVAEIEGVARAVRDEGIADAVVLGMGGSSLGAEVLARAGRRRAGYPRLQVLDSTVPAWFEAVARKVDLERTLFVVSSKSGTTVEMTSLHALFRNGVGEALGPAAGNDEIGRRFVAVTDPGTPLATGGEAFRHRFLNPPDVGGRFSVLTYFGLVPAALAGVELEPLLEAAAEMAEACRRPQLDGTQANPGARLGAILGAAAAAGRDKLTLVTSPRLASFGLWAEQLIAESTGKEGQGILPVAGEPAAAPESYGADRLFVALRLAGDDDGALDAHLAALADAGQPVVELALADPHHLGAELFRWQMATAVAGACLGVHPFDQPDVDAAKRLAKEALAAMALGEPSPVADATADPAAALADALDDPRPSYVALMAYLAPSQQLERAVATLRRRLLAERRLVTTFGYAPRLLHSTGQLHKGGPPGGLHVQLLAAAMEDGPPVPGEAYRLGDLARAQALGDARALENAGRRCLTLTLAGGAAEVAEAVAALAAELG